MSTVYTCFSTDVLHEGHLNIIKEAKKYGKVVVVVDEIENDLSRTCRIGEKLIAEPGRPVISAAKRYIIGINNKLIYSRVIQKRDKSVIYVLGVGEVQIKDILIWCNARKMCRV